MPSVISVLCFQVLPFSQSLLLWCATPDAVVRSREEHWNRVYHDDQQHEHLAQYLQHRLQQQPRTVIIAQVTSKGKSSDIWPRLCTGVEKT